VLLTITTTHRPATDLGCLLHQHLDTVQSVSFPFGQAMVCFSQADEARCTASVMVQAQPPAPSFVGVALAEMFGPALEGRSDIRPEVAGRALPFEVELPALPCAEGPTLVRRLFVPLGYHVAVAPVPVDPRFPGLGSDDDLAVRLTGIVRLADLLSHLCVLLPVLDDRRRHDGHHGDDRLGKLQSQGEPWIGTHPESSLIGRRYARCRTTRVV
jgi:RNA repair, ligase-Pnkp-associating, region of Hen1